MHVQSFAFIHCMVKMALHGQYKNNFEILKIGMNQFWKFILQSSLIKGIEVVLMLWERNTSKGKTLSKTWWISSKKGIVILIVHFADIIIALQSCHWRAICTQPKQTVKIHSWWTGRRVSGNILHYICSSYIVLLFVILHVSSLYMQNFTHCMEITEGWIETKIRGTQQVCQQGRLAWIADIITMAWVLYWKTLQITETIEKPLFEFKESQKADRKHVCMFIFVCIWRVLYDNHLFV